MARERREHQVHDDLGAESVDFGPEPGNHEVAQGGPLVPGDFPRLARQRVRDLDRGLHTGDLTLLPVLPY